MPWLEAIAGASRSLRRNPGRSGLTILGLAIGVATFIATVSFGLGARASVVQQFEFLGVNVLTVKRMGRGPRPLSDRDVRQLEAGGTTFERVVPVRVWAASLVRDGREVEAELRASTPEYFELVKMRFSSGGPFDTVDMERRAKVCILGRTQVDALFPHGGALGGRVRVDGKMSCRVIGILERQGTATSGRDLDNLIMVPSTTASTYLVSPEVSYAFIQVRPKPELRSEAEAEIDAILRRSHDIPDGDARDFKIQSPDDAMRVADNVASIMTGLLGSIAAVSLLVGGIGIMNIQLVAVAERTKEIGIKAAIGASPKQILTQFLAEAMFLALVGTTVGAVLGVGISAGVATAMRWPGAIPPGPVATAVGFGAVTGILFGLLPARRAAALDPVVALRQGE